MYKVNFCLLLLPAALFLTPILPATAEQVRDLPIDVQAESGTYDADRGATHLRENVRIIHGDLIVHADEGFAYQSANRLQRVELTGNPATWRMTDEKGHQTEGASDRIIYDLTGNRVTMIGNARVQDARGSFSGQRLVYDFDSQRTEGEGGIQFTIEPEARDNGAGNGQN